MFRTKKKEFSDHGDKTKMTIISHREGTLTNAIMVLYVAATALNKRKQKVTKLQCKININQNS